MMIKLGNRLFNSKSIALIIYKKDVLHVSMMSGRVYRFEPVTDHVIIDGDPFVTIADDKGNVLILNTDSVECAEPLDDGMMKLHNTHGGTLIVKATRYEIAPYLDPYPWEDDE